MLYLADCHLSDRVTGFWRQRRAQSRTEIFNRGNQHEIRQHTATHHQSCDPRSDDVADAKQCRIVLDRDRTALEWLAENLFRHFFHQFKNLEQPVVGEADDASGDDDFAAPHHLISVGERPAFGMRGLKRFLRCCSL